MMYRVDEHTALLLNEMARDVSRLTGIPWYWARIHQHGQQHPTIDLLALSWWDRWRICWALVGALFQTDCVHDERRGIMECLRGSSTSANIRQ